MRERIANLICMKMFGRPINEFSPEHLGFVVCHSLTLDVLKELENPTDTMVLAGINEGDHKPGNWYPAMIQAAMDAPISLNEQSGNDDV